MEGLPAPVLEESGGCRLSVRRVGRGPSLVVLHGGPGLDHHVLLPLALELAPDLETCLPDLPGHGGSRRSHPQDLSELVRETGAWIAGLAPGPSVLAGHSLGAWIALELLRSGLVKPRAAVLVSPPRRRAGQRSAPAREALPSRPGHLRRQVLETEEAAGPVSPEFRQAVRLCDVRPPAAHAELLQQLHRALARERPRTKPPCPLLILCGERDATSPPEQAERLHASLPGSRLAVVPGAGHFPFAGEAPATAAEIRAFLQRCGVLPRSASRGRARSRPHRDGDA